MSFAIAPLDGPHTLRPLVAAFVRHFTRVFGGPRHAGTVWHFVSLLAILLPVALACINYWRPAFSSAAPSNATPKTLALRVLTSWTLFIASILLSIVVVRLPSLLLPEQNVDESQFIASAQKLAVDPIFFRSVDCGTVGPVDVYPLTLPFLFGGTPDFASSRLIAMAMLFGVVGFLYLGFARLDDDRLARLAVLPLAGIFAAIYSRDLRHYASEIPTLLLVAGGVYCVLRLYQAPDSFSIWFAALGLLGGLCFFAKMQAAPLLFSEAVIAFLFLCSRRRKLWWRAIAWTTLGAVLPLIVNAGVAIGAGVWTNFWNAYILANLAYTGEKLHNSFASFPQFVLQVPELHASLFALAVLTGLWLLQRTLVWRRCTGLWLRCVILAAAGGVILLGMILARDREYLVILGLVAAFAWFQCSSVLHGRPANLGSWMGILACGLLLAGFVAVYLPHRHYPHYLLLLLIPIEVALASMLLQPGTASDSTRNSGFPFLLLFIVITAAVDVLSVPRPPEMAHDFAFARRSIRGAEGDYIRSLSPGGGSMVVWGWDAKLYLESGLVPATQDTNMRNFFQSTAAIDSFYQHRFESEIARSRPEVFVDAAVPESRMMNQRFNIESIPDVAAYVENHYRLVNTDADGKRYFVRDDLHPNVAPPAH